MIANESQDAYYLSVTTPLGANALVLQRFYGEERVSDLFEFYQFAECFCYVPGGDVLNVLYGVEGSNS